MKQLFARSRPAQFQGLQFVRANAVLLVVLCHAVAVLGLPSYFDRTVWGGFFSKGAVGVDIFFVLSGFIIVHVALRSKTLEAKAGLSNFLLKRGIRIIPFLWVAVIAYAIVRYIGSREFEWSPYLNSLFLFPVGEVRPNVVWSLRHEALFYMVFAVAFLLHKRMPYLLYAWCAAPVIVWTLTSLSEWRMPPSEILEFVFNRANALFGCGVLIGILCKRYDLLPVPRRGRPVLAWVALGFVSLAAFLVRDSLNTAAVAVAASAVIVVGLLTPNAETGPARFWEMLGNASYSIYLTHNLFLLVGATVWLKLVGRFGFEFAVAIIGTLAIFGGILVHFVVERPLIDVTTRLVSRKNVPALVD